MKDNARCQVRQGLLPLLGLLGLSALACTFILPVKPPAPSPVPTAAPPAATRATLPPPPDDAALLTPADLSYLGAFRLPADAPDEIGWAWSGEALACNPDGDPDGPDDGFPGSLFGTGHNWNQYVSEIAIPVPVLSPDKDPTALNTAATLQSFHDIRQGVIEWPLEQARVGLAYLPPQGEQERGKLYFAWAQHLDEGATRATHGWADTDLAHPHTAGPWRIGDYPNYVTGDYLFEIPREWADAYTPGMRLATGRYRDGGQGSLGPALFAIGPWNEGNPPPAGATLHAVPLLLYGSVYEEDAPAMEGYAHSDHWSGGAWLTAGGKSAVIFVGTKGVGETWYGCPDGTVWPDEPPFPPACDDRGWWSEQFVAQILFYNPAELAAVATGAMESWEPQPYAVMEIEEVLYNPDFVLLNHLGAAAFDRRHGLLYVMEPLADEDRPLIHVWKVQ